MTLTATWHLIPETSMRFRAACGRKGCCPELASGQLCWGSQQIDLYAMRAGMVKKDTEWRLSGRAKRQWIEFRTGGGNWKDFKPEGRHFYRDPMKELRGLDPEIRHRLRATGPPGARQLAATMLGDNDFPVRVRCPLCEWLNEVHPIAVG